MSSLDGLRDGLTLHAHDVDVHQLLTPFLLASTTRETGKRAALNRLVSRFPRVFVTGRRRFCQCVTQKAHLERKALKTAPAGSLKTMILLTFRLYRSGRNSPECFVVYMNVRPSNCSGALPLDAILSRLAASVPSFFWSCDLNGQGPR